MSIVLDILIVLFVYGILLYSVLLISSYLLIGLFAIRETDIYLHKNDFTDYRLLASSPHAPHVTIIAPAYNEGKTIVDNIRSLLSIQYSNLELIVVNDGSKDDSLQKMINAYQLIKVNFFIDSRIPSKPIRGVYRSKNPRFKKLLIIDKENGGKGDTLNVGINAASNNYVVCIDADCVLEQDSILKMVKPFLEETDEKVIASGGVIRIANSCVVEDGRITQINMPKDYLPRIQSLEYIRAFLLGRMAWSRLNGLMIISGAFGMFRKEIAIECGGYDHKTVGEDMEMVVRMRRLLEERKEKYRIIYIPDPLCWTEAPFSLEILGRQRNRWTRGLFETLRIHKKMFLNPDYRLLGALSYPYWFFFEMLGPLVEFLGFVVFIVLALSGLIDWDFFFIFLGFIVLFGQAYSVFAIYMEVATYYQYKRKRDIVNLIVTALSEPFYFHPFIVYSALKGYIDLIKKKSSWGEMTRQGFGTSTKNEGSASPQQDFMANENDMVVDYGPSYSEPAGPVSLSSEAFGTKTVIKDKDIPVESNPFINFIYSLLEKASDFLSLYLIFFIVFLFERIFELLYNEQKHGTPKFFGSVIVDGFLKDVGFCFELGLGLFIFYAIISLISKKIARISFIAVAALITIIQLSLSQYFLTTLVPLGGDLWGYSLADINQTVGAGGGVPILVIIMCLFFIGLLISGVVFISKRIKLSQILSGTLLIIFSIALVINSASLTNTIQPGEEFSNNLSTNKSWYFYSSSYKHFFPDVKRADIFSTVTIAKIDTTAHFSFKYLDEANYPFLHSVDTSRNVLGAYFDSSKTPPNIVMILVEGLGRAFTNQGAYLGNFTPFLDSLSGQSLYWQNFLSEGGRTFAVLPSILGSNPFNKNGFNELADNMPQHFSLINILKNNGYNTSFYYGGDAHFDFMDTYLKKSGITSINDLNTFPSGYIQMPKSNGSLSWGYGDKELFRRFLETKQNNPGPFLSILLTLSTHSPFLINDQQNYLSKFESRLNELHFDEAQKIVTRNYKDQYASILFMDDAIKGFIDQYKKRADFKNTVFIITGDHRMPEIPMTTKIDRYHVPFIIFSPMLKRHKTFESISTHFDVTPSLLGWLKNSFSFKVPSVSSWMGYGLDTEAVFRNIHSYPFMQTKNNIDDFVKEEYMLNDTTLSKIDANMGLYPENNDSKKRELKDEMDRFKLKNDKFIQTKTLMPDSILSRYFAK